MSLQIFIPRSPALRPLPRHIREFAVAACAAALVASFTGCTKGDLRPSQQVLLEAAAFAGQSPWMESVSSPNVPTEVARVQRPSTTGAANTRDETIAVSGGEVGLYGGTPGVAACDRDKMVTFLETNRPQADAWRNVTGANDIRSYAETLSPVVLTNDTRVTNHGFENGRAAPFQSVLQTGTAVLIDDRGAPRVRCACGNPLAEPQSSGKQEFAGTQWKTFKTSSVVTVQQAVNTLDKIELVSVPVTDAPPPPTPFAAITPGAVEPEPAPETTLPPGATLVRDSQTDIADPESEDSESQTDSDQTATPTDSPPPEDTTPAPEESTSTTSVPAPAEEEQIGETTTTVTEGPAAVDGAEGQTDGQTDDSSAQTDESSAQTEEGVVLPPLVLIPEPPPLELPPPEPPSLSQLPLPTDDPG